MTLTKDNRYDTDALTFVGWSTGDTHIPGMVAGRTSTMAATSGRTIEPILMEVAE